MPIYCNDNILLYVGDNSLGTYKDYLKQAELKLVNNILILIFITP